MGNVEKPAISDQSRESASGSSAEEAINRTSDSALSEEKPPRKAILWYGLTGLIIAVALYFWMLSESAPNLAWMAWTKPTAIFFITILCLLIAMSVWEAISPGSGTRVGILRIETTRGDRLFLSLLGSAFINLAWLGWIGPDLWKALGASLVYALLVFTLV